MKNNDLLLEIPVFRPEYKKWKKYGYTNPKEKQNLQELLCETSKGYCMYCYTRVQIDGKVFGNLEHAIEKNNSKKLTECIPDIGLACPICNTTFKRIGEKKRKLPSDLIKIFEKNSKCAVSKRKQCTVPCKALKKLCEAYVSMEQAQIILQPMGIVGSQSGGMLELQYDVMKMEFQPSFGKHTYTQEELNFIYEHINRFRLNDARYKTRQLYEFIKIIIDHQGFIPKYQFSNMIVELFFIKLVGRSTEEILKICRSIYLSAFLYMS